MKHTNIVEILEQLTETEKTEVLKQLRPIALRATYEYEKDDNWKKYSNKPK